MKRAIACFGLGISIGMLVHVCIRIYALSIEVGLN